MMFKKLLLIMLLTVPCTKFCSAMEPFPTEPEASKEKEDLFSMPSEIELRDMFSKVNLNHFVNHTKVIESLAGKRLNLEEIENVKKTMLNDYLKIVPPMMVGLTSVDFEHVIGKILKESKSSNEKKGLITKRDVLKITMPDEKKLRKLFLDVGLNNFVEKTNIIELWAGKQLLPEGIEISKQLTFFDYSKKVSKFLLVATKMNFDLVIDKILKDYPEAKKQLQLFRDEIKKGVESDFVLIS